jgi:hypothetical protein
LRQFSKNVSGHTDASPPSSPIFLEVAEVVAMKRMMMMTVMTKNQK